MAKKELRQSETGNSDSQAPDGGDWAAEPVFYENGEGVRSVDLRPVGADCIPLFAYGNIRSVRPGARMHVHPGYVEVNFYLRGRVRYETEDGIVPVLPGQVFVSRPGEPHRRIEYSKGMKLYRLLFALPGNGGRLLGLAAAESAAIAGALLALSARLFRATPRLAAAFARIFPLYDADVGAGGAAAKSRRGDASLRRLEMRCAALELLLALIEAPEACPAANGSPTRKVREIARRIEEHPEEDWPIRALAAEAGVSQFAFREMFKRLTGLTPHAYLVDLRVRRARADLERGVSPVSLVSDTWGFSSPQHMATAFRRILGVAPTDVAANVR